MEMPLLNRSLAGLVMISSVGLFGCARVHVVPTPAAVDNVAPDDEPQQPFERIGSIGAPYKLRLGSIRSQSPLTLGWSSGEPWKEYWWISDTSVSVTPAGISQCC